MISALPAFAYCVQVCSEQGRGNCTTMPALDAMFFERWYESLGGVEMMSKAITFEWDMARPLQKLLDGKQMFIYVPACVYAIEVAVNVRKAIMNSIRLTWLGRGGNYTEPACLIRVDERLNKGDCGANQCGIKIQEVWQYLRADSQNENYPSDSQESSGHGIAEHFDCSYLHRRCQDGLHTYHTDDQQFSMARIIENTPRMDFKTGNVIIAGPVALQSFVDASELHQGYGGHQIKPESMLRLQSNGTGAWIAAFFSEYTLTRPMTLSPAQRWARANPHARASENPYDQPKEEKPVNDVSKSDVLGKLRKIGLRKLKQYTGVK